MNRLSRSRAYQRWSALSRRVVAPLAVLLVAISLLAVVSPEPSNAATKNYLPSAPKTQSIPHTNLAAAKLKPPAKLPTAPKATAWPSAGDADLSLAPLAINATVATPQHAGKLPILISSTPNRTSTADTATTPTPVHVHVANQDDAHKAGVTGVLFSVNASAPVAVGVDYSAFRDAAGADWSSVSSSSSCPRAR